MSVATGRGFWIGVSFLAAFGLARVVATHATQTEREDVLGKKAPDFELKTVEGETLNLEELEGKVVLVDFWAVWCGPCKTSMPFFQELADKYEDDGLEVLGVHVDDRMPPPEKVGEYLEEAGVRYTNLISTVDTDNAFQIYAMPTTYLVDRKGVIVKRHIGFNPKTAPAELEEAVRGLLELD